MVCVTVVLLPAASVATHVRNNCCSSVDESVTVTSLKSTVNSSQLSVKSTTGTAGMSLPQSTVSLDGASTTCGASLSLIVMVCVTVVLLPAASVATHVRNNCCSSVDESVTVTSLKSTVNSSQLSVKSTVGTAGISLPQSTVSLDGAVTTCGASLSLIVMVCVALEVFPAASTATQVRRRTCSSVDESVTIISLKSKEYSSQLSVIVTGTTGGISLPQSTVISAATPEITGGMLSLIVMVCVAETLLPATSVATHVRNSTCSCVDESVTITSLRATNTSQLSVTLGDGTAGISLPQSTVASEIPVMSITGASVSVISI